MGPIWMTMNNYSGLGPLQWYNTPKFTLDGANLCMLGDASHHKIPSVEGHEGQTIAIQ